jgi:hypothetical protein
MRLQKNDVTAVASVIPPKKLEKVVFDAGFRQVRATASRVADGLRPLPGAGMT